jgi:glycine cleavage system regulatory protein
MTLIDKACYERGCACYDSRVDRDGVEVVQRKWVGLTDEEIAELEETTTCLVNESWLRNLTRAIEAKLKEKNEM